LSWSLPSLNLFFFFCPLFLFFISYNFY
jgi:hypothetical protein